MATMDSIKLAGGEPANFLDIGTVNDPSRVVNAFRILTADESVKAVLINIFGGMARVDVIAQGVVDAPRGRGGKGRRSVAPCQSTQTSVSRSRPISSPGAR